MRKELLRIACDKGADKFPAENKKFSAVPNFCLMLVTVQPRTLYWLQIMAYNPREITYGQRDLKPRHTALTPAKWFCMA